MGPFLRSPVYEDNAFIYVCCTLYSPAALMASDIQGRISTLGQDTDSTEKKLPRLQKKLKRIQSLKVKQAEGVKLEANQVSR